MRRISFKSVDIFEGGQEKSVTHSPHLRHVIQHGRLLLPSYRSGKNSKCLRDGRSMARGPREKRKEEPGLKERGIDQGPSAKPRP